MKSAGKARNNGLYRHIRTSKEIIRNLLNDSMKMLEKYFVLTRKIFAFPSLQHRSAFGKSFPQSAGIIK